MVLAQERRLQYFTPPDMNDYWIQKATTSQIQRTMLAAHL